VASVGWELESPGPWLGLFCDESRFVRSWVTYHLALPIGARPVPPHLGQTGGCLVSGVAGFKSTITPVPRQAAHLSSAALCFGFSGYMGAFLLAALAEIAVPRSVHFHRSIRA
jgi:hypothetical protein